MLVFCMDLLGLGLVLVCCGGVPSAVEIVIVARMLLSGDILWYCV